MTPWDSDHSSSTTETDLWLCYSFVIIQETETLFKKFTQRAKRVHLKWEDIKLYESSTKN